MNVSRIKLKPKTKSILIEWFYIILGIYFFMYLYFIVAWWGLEPYLQPGLFNDYLDSGYIHLEILVQGAVFGIMFGLINLFVDNSKIRRKSFGAIVLFKTIFYAIALALSQMSVFAIYHVFSILPMETLSDMQQELSISTIFSVGIYYLFVVLVISLVIQINRKFGKGVLIPMITGKYHKPRQEKRIFMFLDMKDSTGNAERLGHNKYSGLIQNSIHDLTDLIIRYKAQVYQYVGDEVVLTWPTKSGIQDLNCINLFYAFEQVLNDRKSFYEENYQTIPEFKAGLDEGTITVAEVGDLKREIAYHGEVLHTAARLEKMCNSLEQKILVTQNLIAQIPEKDAYEWEHMGDYQLRGKEQREEIFAANRIA
jgi:adenylate cyclase